VGHLCVFSISKQVETDLTLTFSIDIAQFIITDSSAPSAEIEQWQIEIHDLTIAQLENIWSHVIHLV
jgi:hypothetical protein